MKSGRLVIAMFMTLISISVFAQQGMRLMGPMHETLSELSAVKMTGDPDYDFATMISTHHKGGIEMLNEEISNGSDHEVKALAQRIKTNQEKELEELQKFVSDKTESQSNDEFMKEMTKILSKAKEQMSMNMNLTGNIDRDFITLMSIHHEHGIDMVNAELKYGKDEDLKSLARRMLEDQEKERKELDALKNGSGMGKMKQEISDSASSAIHYQ
ncbi:MAG TPA: DUF305 domain-containing protein [Bacteroidales bacterium]|nr:DUF305 domain-containing protein [Bacteroidales bacterium]